MGIKIYKDINDINSIKAFIFDLDGTLIDTEKIYHIVWPITMREMGYELPEERFLKMRSLGRPYAPKQFKEWYGEDFDYDGARRIRKGHFDAYVAEHGIQLKKGTIELLEFLKDHHITTAIATATDLNRALEYTDMVGITKYFDRIISATMVDEGKPSPKVYQYAANELGLNPSECIAVEDAPNGVLSAFRAGLNTIMVPDLSMPDEELLKTMHIQADSLLDIMNLFT